MKHTILMIILQLASSGADAYKTHQTLALHVTRCEAVHGREQLCWTAVQGVERNPFVRPFVRTTAGQVAFFGTTASLKVALPIGLRKHGHRKLAAIAEWAGIADSAEGATFSWLKGGN